MDPADFQPRRHFTPAEANRMLPLVRRIARDIQSCYTQWIDEYERRRQAIGGEPGEFDDEDHELTASFEQCRRQLAEYVQELDQLGVLLKGPREGLVDFPTLRDGRTVFLCWKLGESEVSHWHEVDEGFLGRQPLEPELTAGLGNGPAHK